MSKCAGCEAFVSWLIGFCRKGSPSSVCFRNISKLRCWVCNMHGKHRWYKWRSMPKQSLIWFLQTFNVLLYQDTVGRKRIFDHFMLRRFMWPSRCATPKVVRNQDCRRLLWCIERWTNWNSSGLVARRWIVTFRFLGICLIPAPPEKCFGRRAPKAITLCLMT